MNRYIRLDTMWSASAWLIVLSAEARLCWVELLCYVKNAGRDGTAKALVPIMASRMWGLGEESVRQLLTAAQNHGALEIVDGDWHILKWPEYQGDPTGAERQKRFRNTRKTPSNALPTVTSRETDTEKEKDTENTPPLPPSRGKKSQGERFIEALPEAFSRSKGFRSALTEYLAHRSQLHVKPYTDAGLKRIATSWSAFTPDEVKDALVKSIEQNYQGVFPKKKPKKADDHFRDVSEVNP